MVGWLTVRITSAEKGRGYLAVAEFARRLLATPRMVAVASICGQLHRRSGRARGGLRPRHDSADTHFPRVSAFVILPADLRQKLSDVCQVS